MTRQMALQAESIVICGRQYSPAEYRDLIGHSPIIAAVKAPEPPRRPAVSSARARSKENMMKQLTDQGAIDGAVASGISMSRHSMLRELKRQNIKPTAR